MKKIIGLFLFAVMSFMLIQITADDKKNVMLRKDLFVSGNDGYNTYRIPALINTNNNILLAFCEGRKNSAGDVGDIDLLLKRSLDGGKNWSKNIIIHEEGDDAPITIGNPCPIIERSNNCIHLLFTRNNKRLFYTKSIDDGLSWEEPKEFTQILKNLNYPLVRIATGPGHGIQMKNGRLVAPIWVCDREREDRDSKSTNSRFQSGIIYSDDKGATWKAGGLVPPTLNRLNECTVIERTDGSLLLNMRGYDEGFRAVSTSSDNGLTWSKPILEEKLPCPTCQASMIRTGKSEILFLNPAGLIPNKNHSSYRKNLTLRLSLDEGETWAYSHILNKGPAAYSDLAVTEEGDLFCLFENGEEKYHEKITIVKVNRDYLRKSK